MCTSMGQSRRKWYITPIFSSTFSLKISVWSSFRIPYHYRFWMGTLKEWSIHLHSKWRKCFSVFVVVVCCLFVFFQDYVWYDKDIKTENFWPWLIFLPIILPQRASFSHAAGTIHDKGVAQEVWNCNNFFILFITPLDL